MAALALDLESLEDGLLERQRCDVKRRGDCVVGPHQSDGLGEALWLEGFVVPVCPVRGERPLERSDEFRVDALRRAHVPFEPGDLRREVRFDEPM